MTITEEEQRRERVRRAGDAARRETWPHGAETPEALRQMRAARAAGWRVVDHYAATAKLERACYLDDLHVSEPVNTMLNTLLVREMREAANGTTD